MDSESIRGDEIVARPAGGYRLIPARQIAALWWAYKKGRFTAAGFRAWAAAQEAVARRCIIPRGKVPRFEIEELRALTQLSRKRLGEAIRGLDDAGLLNLRPDAIEFGDGRDHDHDHGDDFRHFLDAIPNRRRLVPVPRRVLRLIAQGARPALVAVLFAHLLRCLYIRDGQCDGRGRCKASWVAQTFGVDLRRVKDARRELVAIGWLAPVEGDPQWARNRWGGAYRIDLDWANADECRRTPPTPPPAQNGTRPPPPGSPNEEPLPRGNHQQPADGGPTGVKIPEQGGGRQGSATPSPDLRHVVVEDLGDTGRLLALRDQAKALGLIGASESDSLRFVAAAEHARAVATVNAPGLFASLVRRGLWEYLTASDESSASSRLRRHRRGPSSPTMAPVLAAAPLSPVAPLSSDAQVVRAIRSAASSAGYRGDAFPLLRRERPDWTRSRWDLAVLELETSWRSSPPSPSPSPSPMPVPAGLGFGSPGSMAPSLPRPLAPSPSVGSPVSPASSPAALSTPRPGDPFVTRARGSSSRSGTGMV